MPTRLPELSYETKLEQIRMAIDKSFKDAYVVYTFPDAVIIKDYKQGKHFEIEYSILDGKI